jgi:hypothetical protein
LSSLSFRDDAIRESNNLGKRAFAKQYRNNVTALCFNAVHPDSGAELGYIRRLKKSGIVEMTNYNSWLSGKSLGIGGTSRKGQDHLAGDHGEGYKLAVLTLMRHDYAVSIKASKCDWKFKIPAKGQSHAGVLCVDIKPKNDTKIQELKDAYARKNPKNRKITLRKNVWEDVTFKIGTRGGRAVTEEDFQQWIRVALDLDPPTRVLDTVHGTILLEARFKNKMFLKGILLECCRGVPKNLTSDITSPKDMSIESANKYWMIQNRFIDLP